MKLNRITLQNIKSFKEEIVVDFKPDINILIGPNAGGKSNMMDILNIVVNHYFVHNWRLKKQTLSDGTFRKSIQHREDIFNPIENFLEKNLEIKDLDQKIKLKFELDKTDLENIDIVNKNKENLLEYAQNEHKDGNLNNFFKSINVSENWEKFKLDYEIINHLLNHNSEDFPNNRFLSYLNNFEGISILINEYNSTDTPKERITKLYPLSLYFSPYRNPTIENLRSGIADKDQFDLIQSYKKNTSKSTSSILEYASFYFGLKMRIYNDSLENFKQDIEVKFVEKFLKKLGYSSFETVVVDKQKNIYEINLKKQHKNMLISRASSGEKEILSLLMGIFAFNIKGGLIFLDEPDLHLHPRWQRLFLDLFIQLSKERNIQFFIATHSPQFVSTKSLKNTYRVYKEDDTSKIYSPVIKETKDSDTKDIFQIINVLNNEKIFFADKILLVEGVVDRIIYEKILKLIKKKIRNTETVEVLEVYGKDNFKKFTEFMKSWKIISYIFADRDYVATIGDDNMKNLFKVDFEKMKKSLYNKNSKDVKSLLKNLNGLIKKKKNEINQVDLTNLSELFSHLKKRHFSLKENVNPNEKKKMTGFIKNQYENNIFILLEGDIEDYFGGGHFDIKKAIVVASNLNGRNIPKEIETNIKKILKD